MCRADQHGLERRPFKKVRFAEQTPLQSPRQSPRQTPQKPSKVRGSARLGELEIREGVKVRGSVRLGDVEIREGVQFFAIDIFPGNGEAPWRVMRRYNQFRDLAEKFGFDNVPARFPGKVWADCTGSVLEDRRQGLENWLSQAIIRSSRKHHHWIPALRSFLEISAYREPKVSSQSLGSAPGAVASGPRVTPRKSVSGMNSSIALSCGPSQQIKKTDVQSGTIADQLFHAVVPSWQSLLNSVEIKVPQIGEVVRSAVAQSKVLEMLD